MLRSRRGTRYNGRRSHNGWLACLPDRGCPLRARSSDGEFQCFLQVLGRAGLAKKTKGFTNVDGAFDGGRIGISRQQNSNGSWRQLLDLAENLGAFKAFQKPFRKEELLVTVKNLLA